MSPKDQRAIVGAITAGSSFALPTEMEIGIRLWPKLTTNRFRRQFVEPDVVFDLGAGAKVIVEVKWNAPLGKHELAAQWAALDKAERAESLHILLVREPNRYKQSISEDAQALRAELGETSWDHRRREVSWRDMAQAIRMLGTSGSLTPGGRSWAQKAAALLSSEEFDVQVGWAEIGLRRVAEIQWKFLAREVESA
jgi:hypothetical protein